MGSKANNKNGEILEEILINTNLIQLNNKQPTYHRTHDNSSDILDWILVSNNLYSQFGQFQVLENNLVDSDHYPILVTMDIKKGLNKNTNYLEEQFNFNKTDWKTFQEFLNAQHIDTKNQNIDKINEELNEIINKAASISTPAKKKYKEGKSPIPDFLHSMIKFKISEK